MMCDISTALVLVLVLLTPALFYTSDTPSSFLKRSTRRGSKVFFFTISHKKISSSSFMLRQQGSWDFLHFDEGVGGLGGAVSGALRVKMPSSLHCSTEAKARQHQSGPDEETWRPLCLAP